MADLSPEEIARLNTRSEAWVIALNKALILLVAAVMVVLVIFKMTEPAI